MSEYTITTVKNGESSRYTDEIKGTAETIQGALNAAWELNRYTETDVEIHDEERLVATVRVEWEDW